MMLNTRTRYFSLSLSLSGGGWTSRSVCGKILPTNDPSTDHRLSQFVDLRKFGKVKPSLCVFLVTRIQSKSKMNSNFAFVLFLVLFLHQFIVIRAPASGRLPMYASESVLGQDKSFLSAVSGVLLGTNPNPGPNTEQGVKRNKASAQPLLPLYNPPNQSISEKNGLADESLPLNYPKKPAPNGPSIVSAVSQVAGLIK